MRRKILGQRSLLLSGKLPRNKRQTVDTGFVYCLCAYRWWSNVENIVRSVREKRIERFLVGLRGAGSRPTRS